MSTRAAITRRQGDGFVGVYHHWDGNPDALGATLFRLAQERELGGLLRLLIDEHPAGWSTINGADLDAQPGFQENGFTTTGPECYCHGGRSEEAQPITEQDDMGMEWAYVFDEQARTMAVCERVRPDGDHAMGAFGTLGTSRKTDEREDAWAIRAVVALDGPVPDWAALDGEG